MPQAIDIFETHRQQLLGLAYRITGSRFEAEDIIQETGIKWMAADHAAIDSPYAWLVTVATRQSLDHLKSARVQRESYIGPWLPEPFIVDTSTPESELELDESITMALLLLLEQLSPQERATFILHDLFHFNFDDIASILNKSGDACRQLASRARRKIDKDLTQPSIDKNAHRDIVNAFFNAVKQGDMTQLLSLLKTNVTLHADGGGKATAARRILEGQEQIAKFLLQVVSTSFNKADVDLVVQHTWFNGAPGFVVWHDRQPVSAFNFEMEQGRIRKIHVLRNPDKLALFKQVADTTQ